VVVISPILENMFLDLLERFFCSLLFREGEAKKNIGNFRPCGELHFLQLIADIRPPLLKFEPGFCFLDIIVQCAEVLINYPRHPRKLKSGTIELSITNIETAGQVEAEEIHLVAEMNHVGL
jgi:hypothetical protein